MTLFALLGIPVFVMMAYGLSVAPLPAGRRRREPAEEGIPLVDFLKGLVYGVVGAIVVALLHRYVNVPYRPFPVFLYHLVVDYLVAAALALVVIVFSYANKRLLAAVFFAGGFYSVVAVGKVLSGIGVYDPYSLFLRPALYMAAVVYIPLLLSGYREWYGLRRSVFAVALAAIPAASAAVALLERRFYDTWAIVAAAAFLASAAGAFYYSRER